MVCDRYARRGGSGSARATAIEGDTRGGSFAEYLVLVAVVALGGLGAWRTFGADLDDRVAREGDCLASMSSCTTAGYDASAALPPPTADEPEDDDDDCSGFSLCQIGDAADSITDFGGDVLDFGGDVLSTAWDFATDPRAPHLAVPLGIYDATVGTVLGIGNALLHPVQTIEGLVYAAAHPYETAYAFANLELEDFRENPIRAVTAVATDVVIGYATAGAAPAVVVTEEVVSNADTVVQVSEAGQEAQGDEPPAIVETADDYLAPIFFPPTQAARVLEDIFL